MRIKSILLENIRSHVKTLVDFSDGFNCLVGGLGTGKSSILYAVDFALFGDPLGRSYEYLLREGSEIGKIALKFVMNGREYTIWRALRRRDNRINQDMEQLKLFEGEKLIAEMKSDAVAEQLTAVTGIDRDLFREVIWVRQEHLKEILDVPPGERQRKLDQLFGLSDYETSWSNLRSVLRWYESERSIFERDPDVTGIKEIQMGYDEALKSLAEKEVELKDLKRRLAEAEVRLKEASTRLEDLETLRRRNEELRAKESELHAKIMSLEGLSARLVDEIEKRKMRGMELERRLVSLKSQEEPYRRMLQEAGLPSDQGVEQLKNYLESLIDQVSSIQGEEETMRNEIRKSAQRISSLIKESKCPLCLQVLSQDYKEGLMGQLRREENEYKQRLSELEKNIEELEHIRNLVSPAASNLQTILTRIEENERQMEEEQKFLSDAEYEFNQRQREEKTVREQLADLRLKIRGFDVAKLEEAKRQRDEAFEEHSSLKYGVQSVEGQRREIALRVDALKERLDVAQGKVERLERVRGLVELVQEIRQAYRSIQPKLRSEFITYLERVVQQVLDELTGTEGSTFTVRVDENYTPLTESEGGYQREALNLSGGERTLLAFAYRLGVGHLIMQSRVGHGLRMLLLDEPTESLGREDGSIDRLAEAISRLRTVEQIISVTHSEAFAEKADHVIRLEKRDNQSIVSVER